VLTTTFIFEASLKDDRTLQAAHRYEMVQYFPFSPLRFPRAPDLLRKRIVLVDQHVLETLLALIACV